MWWAGLACSWSTMAKPGQACLDQLLPLLGLGRVPLIPPAFGIELKGLQWPSAQPGACLEGTLLPHPGPWLSVEESVPKAM